MFPFWIWIVGTCIVFCFVLWVSKYVRVFIVPNRHEHNDFLDPSQQLLGLIYGVLLAFVVVFSWQNYTDLTSNLDSEAISLLNLWEDAQVFDPEYRDPFQDSIVSYLRSILTEEWDLMEQGEKPSINVYYSEILKNLGNLQAKTEVQKAFLQNVVEEVNKVNSFRRARIVAVTSSTPWILWAFLIGGGICILILTGLYNVSRKLYILLCSLQTFILVFAFYLISNFNHPFQGALAVKGDGYLNVLETIIGLKKHGLD